MNETNEQVKKYLSSARVLSRGIRFKLERIQELRELSESATSTMSATRTSGTSRRSKLENCICAIDELEREIEVDVIRMREDEKAIREMIRAVANPNQKQLLELRYINGKTWEEIAEAMVYSWQHVHKIHVQALASVGDSMRLKKVI